MKVDKLLILIEGISSNINKSLGKVEDTIISESKTKEQKIKAYTLLSKHHSEGLKKLKKWKKKTKRNK